MTSSRVPLLSVILLSIPTMTSCCSSNGWIHPTFQIFIRVDREHLLTKFDGTGANIFWFIGHKWRKTVFRPLNPYYILSIIVFIFNIDSPHWDVYTYQISLSCHMQFLRYQQKCVQSVTWQKGSHLELHNSQFVIHHLLTWAKCQMPDAKLFGPTTRDIWEEVGFNLFQEP